MTLAKAEQLDTRAEYYRMKIGLSLPQWKRLQNDLGMTTEAIGRSYTIWQRYVLKLLDWEERNADYQDDGKPYLSAVQAARALGIGEFHVCNLYQRDKLEGVKLDRNVAYRRADLLRLVNQDYSETKSKRSPLAKSFIRWLELRQAA